MTNYAQRDKDPSGRGLRSRWVRVSTPVYSAPPNRYAELRVCLLTTWHGAPRATVPRRRLHPSLFGTKVLRRPRSPIRPSAYTHP